MDTKLDPKTVIGIALLALLGFSSCTETVVYKQPAPQQTVVVERGPYAPPPPRVEYRPPPPSYAVVWVHGHWRWNGYRWVWIAGHYRRV
jgi:hypothetical protein